jgi:predicted HTH transcriptional regulator
MIRRQLNEVTPDDLYALIENEVEESRTLEFKEDFGTSDGGTRRINDEQKKEFLADVDALANTSGGDLVIGIREESGKASEVVGVALDDPDKEFQKLESILRDSLEPRLPGIQMRSVPVDGRVVLIIR